jgi:hypothetical protein
MPAYRLYCLNSGRIISAHDFVADDDSRALEVVANRRTDLDCELWSGGRFVAVVPLNGVPILKDRSA